MITFFRKIRQKLLSQNRVTQYLTYAIGEVALVMIGILLALQVNNWNETRKAQKAQRDLLSSFLEDLKADSVEFENFADEISNVIEVHDKLYRVKMGELSSNDLENPRLLRGSIRYSSIVMTNHPNFGALIKDEELRKEILDHYRLLLRLDNSYLQYDKVVKEIVRPYLAENLTLNEAFLFDNANEEKALFIMDRFYDVIQRDDFGQVLFEANLKARELRTTFENVLKSNAQLQESIQTKIL
jgi:hypothetical protein